MRNNRTRPPDDYPKPWESRPVSHERWQKHRERMMAYAGAGRRPPEWWRYESGQQRPVDRGDETILLYEMGEFSPAEIKRLLPDWRERYEKTHDDGFAYFTGDVWLKGEAAKLAHLRWAGVPPEIWRRWDEERARTIAELAGIAGENPC